MNKIKRTGISLAVLGALSVSPVGIHMALAQQSTDAPKADAPKADAPKADAPKDPSQRVEKVESIVVTAQRREQRLEDIGAAVTALSKDDLQERGITDFQSYLQTLPSASFADQGSTGNEVKLRGVGSGTSQLSPTTAVYLGEVPIIHTGRAANSSYNFQLIDMDRVEILRGPQGQLYGSNSLGGAIKNIPSAPTFKRFEASGSVGGSDTRIANSSYSVDATFNLPLSNDLAVRITGYDSRQGGWYRNVHAGGPTLGRILAISPPGSTRTSLGLMISRFPQLSGYAAPAPPFQSNDTDITGGRLIALYKPSSKFDAQLMLATERKSTDGPGWAIDIPNVPGTIPGTFRVPGGQFNYTNPSDATKYQYSNASHVGKSDKISLSNLLLNYDFGFAKLTSSTSYWDRTETIGIDIGPISGVVTGVVGTFPVFFVRKDNPKKFVQEFRLTSPSRQPFTWLAGAFYSKIDQQFDLLAQDDSGQNIFFSWQTAILPPARRPQTTVLSYQTAQFVDKQKAIFGEVAYDVTPKVNAAFSFRQFWLDQTLATDSSGFQFLASGRVDRAGSASSFMPKFNLTWKPEQGQLFYATASQGYRTGVVNREVPTPVCANALAALGFPGTKGLPPTVADTVWNFEVGTKFKLTPTVNLNAAIYRIDWKNLQKHVVLNGVGNAQFPANSLCTPDQIINVGNATIDGAELELTAYITSKLHLNGSLSFTNPTFKDNFAPLRIRSGQTIDGTPKSQAFLGLQYFMSLMDKPSYIRGEVSYVGKIANISNDFFAQTPPFQTGNYTQFNLRFGIDITKKMNLVLWGTNLFDKFGVTRQTDVTSQAAPALFTIRPRTIGATLRATF